MHEFHANCKENLGCARKCWARATALAQVPASEQLARVGPGTWLQIKILLVSPVLGVSLEYLCRHRSK